jgi:DNA-binding NtrC family response regulator
MARVLIIDDDKPFREALAESVRDFGHDVLEASGPQEAFKLIEDADVAFLDLKMPGMSGIDFLRESKPVIPVIVLTAFADSSNTIEAIRLGAFDHLTKPIGRKDLQRVLAAALQKPTIIRSGDLPQSDDELIGFSSSMREVQKRIGVATSGEVSVAEYFLRQFTSPPKSLSAAAAKRLLEHSWPGNVRELENVIRSSSLAVRGTVIDARDLQIAPTESRSESSIDDLLELDFHSAVSQFEKLLLEKALKEAGGNRAEAARLLNIHRQLLCAKLKEHGMSEPE